MLIRDLCPAWANFKVEFSTKYLGFLFGPSGHETRWNENVAKFKQRIDLIRDMAPGLPCAIVLFNAFAMTVFSHNAQLFIPPPEVVKIVEDCATKLIKAPGSWIMIKAPGNWITPDLLYS